MFVAGNPLVFADPDGRDRIIKTTTIYEFDNGNSIALTSTKIIKGDFIKLQIRDNSGAVHYQYYDTKVETTNYINAGTGESTGSVTYSSPGTLSFTSDYDIGTLSGTVGRNWEIFKEKWHNLVSEQHEGEHSGGGIMFTSSIGEATDRGPKRPFADATPESIDDLVAMIGQLKTTVDARERAIDVLEAIEKSGVGGLETGNNAAELIETIKNSIPNSDNTNNSNQTSSEIKPKIARKRDSITVTAPTKSRKTGNDTIITRRVPIENQDF